MARTPGATAKKPREHIKDAEISRLKAANGRLKDENKKLKDENKELKKKK